MSLLRSLIGGFGALFRKQRTERDVDEELHAYPDAAAEDNLLSDMGPVRMRCNPVRPAQGSALRPGTRLIVGPGLAPAWGGP
jgi:hypothetical protein